MSVQAPDRAPSTPSTPAAVRPRWARTTWHAVCGGLGPLLGFAVAFAAHVRGWQPWEVLALLVGIAGFVALALPDLVVGPRRAARTAFGLLPVLGAAGGLAVAAQFLPSSWTGLVIGLIAGSAVGTTLQPILFPGLSAERDARYHRDEPVPPPGPDTYAR
jgi:hypothetical protein